MKLIIFLALVLPLSGLSGCMTASQHSGEVQDDSGNKLTVGIVQKEVNVGMSGAAVLEILGSPNIVSTDEERREVWVYDRIATDFVYSNSSGGLSALILGFPSDVLFGGSGGYNKNAGAASRSQRTLTIIIKFGHDNLPSKAEVSRSIQPVASIQPVLTEQQPVSDVDVSGTYEAKVTGRARNLYHRITLQQQGAIITGRWSRPDGRSSGKFNLTRMY